MNAGSIKLEGMDKAAGDLGQAIHNIKVALDKSNRAGVFTLDESYTLCMNLAQLQKSVADKLRETPAPPQNM